MAIVTRFTADCGQLKLAMHPTATAKAQIAPAFRMLIDSLDTIRSPPPSHARRCHPAGTLSASARIASAHAARPAGSNRAHQRRAAAAGRLSRSTGPPPKPRGALACGREAPCPRELPSFVGSRPLSPPRARLPSYGRSTRDSEPRRRQRRNRRGLHWRAWPSAGARRERASPPSPWISAARKQAGRSRGDPSGHAGHEQGEEPAARSCSYGDDGPGPVARESALGGTGKGRHVVSRNDDCRPSARAYRRPFPVRGGRVADKARCSRRESP